MSKSAELGIVLPNEQLQLTYYDPAYSLILLISPPELLSLEIKPISPIKRKFFRLKTGVADKQEPNLSILGSIYKIIYEGVTFSACGPF